MAEDANSTINSLGKSGVSPPKAAQRNEEVKPQPEETPQRAQGAEADAAAEAGARESAVERASSGSPQTKLEFSVPYDRHVVIKVIDKESGEVRTTIPPLAEQMAKLRK